MNPVRVGAALVALLLAIGPGPSGAAEVRDMLGRRVVVPDRPARVVSLAPSLTEVVYAVGAADALVGVTRFCDFPPEATRKPKVGGIYNPNFEAILSLRPDLVLATTEGNREEHIQALERLRIPLYVLRPLDFATVLEAAERVGRLLGRPAETERLVARLRRDADDVARRVREAGRPRVLYVIWGDPLIVPGRDTLITDLVRRAGGESVTGDEPLPYPRFSVEEVLARRPDRVVIGQPAGMPVDERLREWPFLRLLPAVREGRVGAVDVDLIHRPGPRVVDGLRALARLIHPELPW